MMDGKHTQFANINIMIVYMGQGNFYFCDIMQADITFHNLPLLQGFRPTVCVTGGALKRHHR
jgi:hypothetical protein